MICLQAANAIERLSCSRIYDLTNRHVLFCLIERHNLGASLARDYESVRQPVIQLNIIFVSFVLFLPVFLASRMEVS